MIDTIGLLGLLLALVGAAVIVHGMLSMRKLVNGTRAEGQKFTGLFLSPSSSRPVLKAMRAEHPGHPLLKRSSIGITLIVLGVIIMTATNSYTANHS